MPPISSEIPRDMWKMFWKIKSIPKCLNLSWRACKSVLPVMKNLSSRGLEVDIRCPCCGEREETVMHALLLCEEVNQIWFASHLGGRVLINDDVPFVVWFYDCM